MEKSPRRKTLRAVAQRAADAITKGKVEKAAEWSCIQAARFLESELIKEGFKGVFAANRLHWRPGMQNGRRKDNTWRDGFERALAICEAEGVPPDAYFRSVAQSMGFFCSHNKIALTPGHLHGKGATKRYHKWLHRQADSRIDTGKVLARDKRLKKEERFVREYAKVFVRQGMFAWITAKRNTPGYKKVSRRRQVIALCRFLQMVHRDLPDVIVLRKGWRLKDVFEVVAKLLDGSL